MEPTELICPITNKIPQDPVIADDGYCYERYAIEKWMEKYTISPVTKEQMRTCLTNSIQLSKYLANKNIPKGGIPKVVESIAINLSKEKPIEKIKLSSFTREQIRDIITKKIGFEEFVDKLEDINEIGHNGFYRNCTILYFVVFYGELSQVKYLISKGANIELTTKDCYGKRAIHAACSNKNPEISKYLIDLGCDLECTMTCGWRPIHYAVDGQFIEIVNYLIDKGVDLESKTSVDNRPLHLAIMKKCFEMAKILIDKGVELECQNKSGYRPIHFACKYQSLNLIKYLIDKGVDLESKTGADNRPLHIAIMKKCFEMAKILIDKGVELECQNKSGWRPIHFACKYQSLNLIKYLVEKGVDLECETNDGWKPIHFICRYQTLEELVYIVTKVKTTDRIKKYDGEDKPYDIYELIQLNPHIKKPETI